MFLSPKFHIIFVSAKSLFVIIELCCVCHATRVMSWPYSYLALSSRFLSCPLYCIVVFLCCRKCLVLVSRCFVLWLSCFAVALSFDFLVFGVFFCGRHVLPFSCLVMALWVLWWSSLVVLWLSGTTRQDKARQDKETGSDQYKFRPNQTRSGNTDQNEKRKQKKGIICKRVCCVILSSCRPLCIQLLCLSSHNPVFKHTE